MLGRIIKSDAFVLLGLFGVGVVHVIALLEKWYYRFPPLASVLHLSGGFVLGCLFLWLLNRNYPSVIPEKSFLLFFMLLGAVALGGVFWEFFEFILDRFNPSPLFQAQLGVADTMGDLTFDLFGGIFAYLLARFSK